MIHSASGGMGMAALEIARWRGATVYATAGTAAKRDLLQKLGAAKVGDSRSTDFADQLRDPDGPGVDVILNTLKGSAAREANFSLLSSFGRYVETACNELHEGEALPLHLLLPGRAFLPMDLAALHQHRPDTLGTSLRTVTGLLAHSDTPRPAPRSTPRIKRARR